MRAITFSLVVAALATLIVAVPARSVPPGLEAIESRDESVTSVGESGAPGADADETPVWRGDWGSVSDELTIEPRTDAAVAVAPNTPHGVVLWGGVAEDGTLLNDGVLIDSARADQWRLMPDAPLVPRRDFGWASADDRVFIWGGVDQVGRPLSDGAQFQHGWTMLPDNRLPAGPASMTVVDSRLWVVATDPGTGQAKVQSLSLIVEEGKGWGLVADVPLPAGEGHEVVGCCRDEANQLIVFSIQADGTAAAASWDIGDAHSPNFIGGEWTQLGAVPAPLDSPVAGRAIEQQLAAWVGLADQGQVGTGEEAVGVVRQVGYGEEGQWQTEPAPGRSQRSSARS